jgi:hypothetical protein
MGPITNMANLANMAKNSIAVPPSMANAAASMLLGAIASPRANNTPKINPYCVVLAYRDGEVRYSFGYLNIYAFFLFLLCIGTRRAS